MKKVLVLIITIAVCIGVCACAGGNSNSKYVGTYSGFLGREHDDIIAPNGFTASTKGTRTLVLNADGTGTETYVGHYTIDEDEDFTIYSINIKWEVVDDYIYVTGTGRFLIGDKLELKINDRYRLEGKTLVDADSPTSISGKVTKVS